MRTAFAFLTAACLVLVSACGYHLGAAKPAILQNVTTLAIPTFKNKTFEPGIEVLMADATIKQFQSDGTYEIVSDNRADAILYCTLDDVERSQARAVLSNVLATREFKLKLTVQYELVDRVTGASILRGNVNADTSFFTNNDLQIDEQQAIVTAIHKVAVDLVGRISEGF
jgi:outer membrane lipopolysaccharide assembly protein LptE/RlpB